MQVIETSHIVDTVPYQILPDSNLSVKSRCFTSESSAAADVFQSELNPVNSQPNQSSGLWVLSKSASYEAPSSTFFVVRFAINIAMIIENRSIVEVQFQ